MPESGSNMWKKCTFCHGEGSYTETSRVPCYVHSMTHQQRGQGVGFQSEARTFVQYESASYTVTCDICGGTGYVPELIDQNYTLD